MNCKKKLLWVAPIALLAALSSCGEKTSSYATSSLAAPMGISQSGNSFSWFPVEGAAGYVAKLDEGEPYGIAVAKQEGYYHTSLQLELCYYEIPTEELADGKHKIRFASRNDADELSAWSKAYTFSVENEIDLDRPTLTSSLRVSCDECFDSVTYTFNDSIIVKHDIGRDVTSYSPTAKELGLDSLLEDETIYIVTCKVSYEELVSESSNPVTYAYSQSQDRYVAALAPKLEDEEFVFEKAIYNPVFTVKFDGKEFILDYSQSSSSYTSISVNTLLNALVSKEYIEYYDILKAKTHTIALKVNYDASHYLPSEYSSSLTWETNVKDEDLFKRLCSYRTVSFSSDYAKLTVGYSSSYQMGCEFLTISASDQNGSSLSVAKNSDYEEMAVVSVGSAKTIKLTLSYSRLGFTDSETFTYTVPQSSSPFNYNVKAGENGLTWNASGRKDGDEYEVVVKKGTTSKTYSTTSASLSYDEIELEGDLSFTVYTYRNGARISSSGSDAVTFTRNSAPGSLSLDSDLNITLSKGMKAYLYYGTNTSPSGTRSYSSTGSNYVCVGDYRKVEVFYASDGYTTIDSKKSVYYLDRITDLKYSILDGGYLTLADYDISKYVPSAYRTNAYLVTKNGKYAFDMAKYRETTGNSEISLNGFSSSSGSSSTLVKNAVTTVISDTISFTFGPSMVITCDSSNKELNFYAYSDVSYGWYSTSYTESEYNGSYDIKVEKLNSSGVYEEFKTLAKTTSKTYSYSSFEAGSYIFYVRTHGNGYILPGDYASYYFTIS